MPLEKDLQAAHGHAPVLVAVGVGLQTTHVTINSGDVALIASHIVVRVLAHEAREEDDAAVRQRARAKLVRQVRI